MARGRMICKELAGSEKFYGLSDRAKWVYQLATPFTDRDGFLPASGRELSTLFLGGLIPSWEEIEELVREIVGTGLWNAYTDADGRNCLWVYKFPEHQGLRGYQWEPISIYRLPLTGERPPPNLRPDRDERKHFGGKTSSRDDGGAPAPEGKGKEGNRSEAKQRGTRPGNPAPLPDPATRAGNPETGDGDREAAPLPGGGGGNNSPMSSDVDTVRAERPARNRTSLEERAQRLLDAHAAAYDHVNQRNPNFPPLVRPGATIHQAQELAGSLGDVVDMFDADQLVRECARLICNFEEKELRRTFKGMLGQLGQTFPGTDAPNPVIWNENEAPDKPKEVRERANRPDG